MPHLLSIQTVFIVELSNVMDRESKVLKEFVMANLTQGCWWEFQSQMQTLHTFYFCCNKNPLKSAKASIGMLYLCLI